MKTKSMFRALLALVMCCFMAVSAWGQMTYGAEQSNFTAVSADNLGNDQNVSYTTQRGGGTSNPAINSGVIRLYQNGSGEPGGSITLSVAEGYKIKSVTIGSDMTTKVAYSLDNATSPTSAKKDLAKGDRYTVSDLSASSITFYCMGTDKNTRLYVNYLSVTYESVASLFVSIAPENGTEFVGSQQVTLTASNPSATMYYTTNGTTPTVGAEGTKQYSGPFEITESCTVKAVAVNGDVISPVATAEFNKHILSVSIAPENGTEFIGSQQVTLAASYPSARMYYTINGALPDGTYEYTESFEITESCKVNAIAVYGSETSTVATAEFIKKQTPVTQTSYVKVTSTDDLLVGGVYLIVNEEDGYVLGWQKNNNRGVSAVTISNGVISDANCALNNAGDDDGLARELVLGKYNGNYNFYDPIEGGYLYAASSSNNHLKTQTKLNDNGGASISFDSNGNAEIQFQGSNTKNLLRYNKQSSLFSCYSSGQNDIQLYRKVVQAKTAEAVGNCGTFYSECAYRMPQGLTGSVVYAVEGNSIKFTEVYKGGDEVPAYTALLISSGEVAGSFYASVLSKDVEAKHVQADNLLEGGRADDGKTAMSVRSDVLYYKLAVNGSDYGFYWGAEDGAPFTMKNLYTAYLAVPKSLGVKSFNINWNDVTGIEEVKNETRNGAKEGVYTLTGRRIFTDVKKLPKGLYIVNGNKVMVK